MTSLKSLQNNFGYAYRTGLRDNMVTGIINTVFLAIFYCIFPMSTFFAKPSVDKDTGKLVATNFKETYSFLFTENMEVFRYVVICAMLMFGVFMGIAAFRFITGKKTVNVYYSLGIKRSHLFSAKYLSGLTLLVGSVLLPLLVCLLVNIVKLGVNHYMITSIIYLFLGLVSISVFSYSLTSLIFVTVGTSFEGIAFSGILLLFPELFFTCLQKLIEKLVFGTPYGATFSSYSLNMYGDYSQKLTQKYAAFNPIRYFSQGLYVFSSATKKGELTDYQSGKTVAWCAPNFLPIIIWLLISVMIFAVAVYMFERRKAEIGGFIGKNRVLNFIGTFLIATFAFTLFVTYPFKSISKTLVLLLGLLLFLIISALVYLILLRSISAFKKNLLSFPIQLAIVVLIFAFFSTGYFGAAKKVPATADVSYAQITSDTFNYSGEFNSQTMYFYLGSTETSNVTYPVGKYETEKDIDYVRKVNTALVEQGMQNASLPNDDFNGIYPTCIQIRYVMKDGSEILRNYYGINTEILNTLNEYVETDYYKARLNDLFNGEVKAEYKLDSKTATSEQTVQYYFDNYKRQLRSDDSDIYLYNKARTNGVVADLTAEQKQQLRDCIYKDISSQKIQDVYNSDKTLGVIAFSLAGDSSLDTSYNSSYDSVVYSSSSYSTYSGDAGFTTDYSEFGRLYLNTDQIPVYMITSDMVNTINYIKSIGYESVFTQAPAIKSFKVIKVSDIFSSSRSYLVEYKYTIGREFISSNYEGDIQSYNSAYTVDAKDELAKTLYELGALRKDMNPDDYIVIAVLEKDGNVDSDSAAVQFIVDGDKMPESVKQGVAAANYGSSSNQYYY